MTIGQFSNSFQRHFSYLCEYAIRFDLDCSFCEYSFIFHCLHCSPSCFEPDSLLLAHIWLGLSWIDCISANKSFSSSKTSSRKPYTSSKQQERQKHSVEITINFSKPNNDDWRLRTRANSCDSSSDGRPTRRFDGSSWTVPMANHVWPWPTQGKPRRGPPGRKRGKNFSSLPRSGRGGRCSWDNVASYCSQGQHKLQ